MLKSCNYVNSEIYFYVLMYPFHTYSTQEPNFSRVMKQSIISIAFVCCGDSLLIVNQFRFWPSTFGHLWSLQILTKTSQGP